MSCTSLSVFYCIFLNFAFGGQVRHPPYGPWNHVLPHVWTDKSNSADTQDEGEDAAEVCSLCCHKHSTITVSVRSIVVNVLTPTLVAMMLFIKDILSDILCC